MSRNKKFDITGNARVWLAHTWRTVQDVAKEAENNPDEAIAVLTFTAPRHDMSDSGWIEIGTAVITATINDSDTITNAQVKRLTKQIKEIRAEAHKQVRALEDQIQSLLAITHEE